MKKKLLLLIFTIGIVFFALSLTACTKTEPSEKATYFIIYKNTMGVVNDNSDTYTAGDLVSPKPLEKYDYIFNGWRIGSAEGEFVSKETLPVGTTGNLILYADWTQKSEFEGYDYIVIDNYKQSNGEPFCILLGVSDEMTQSTKLEIPTIFNHVQHGILKSCTNLAELTLPFLGSDYTGSSSAYLGYWFGAQSGVTQESYIPSGLKKVSVLGNGKIGDYAFANCSSLEEIFVSGNITSIGRNAYLNCSSLVTLTTPVFPELKSIDYGARPNGDMFDNPEYNVYDTDYYYGLPGSYYHRGTTVLEYGETPDIPVSDKFQTLHINGGFIEANSFFKNLGIKKLIIENVKVVGLNAFAHCSNLTELELGKSVEDIRNLAFSGTAIREVIIPDSVTRLGYDESVSGYACFRFDGVFSEMLNLEKVVIGNGVEAIPAAMFYNSTLVNKKLEITLGKKVQSVSPLAFSRLNYNREDNEYVNSSDVFEITNLSEYKEIIFFVDNQFDSYTSLFFLEALMNSENAPEKVYLGGDRFYGHINSASSGFSSMYGDAALTRAAEWNIYFYTDSNPYQGSTAETGVGYWHYNEVDSFWFYDNYNDDGRVAKAYPTVAVWENKSN